MKSSKRLLCVLGSSCVPALAFAHPGHELTDHFVAGLTHPFTGLDHLLAMLAVGLLAMRSGKVSAFVLPVVFPLAMLAGAVVSTLGFSLPAIEPAIAVSVIVLGALLAFDVRAHAASGAVLIGIFAVFHGYAHAGEATFGVTPSFVGGFVVATFILHLVGIVLAASLPSRDTRRLRIAGSMIGAAGAALLLAA